MRKPIQDELTAMPISRQRKYQLRMQKQKRCTMCGEEAVTRSYCLKHAVEYREKSRKKLKLRRRYCGALTYIMQGASFEANRSAHTAW